MLINLSCLGAVVKHWGFACRGRASNVRNKRVAWNTAFL